MQGMYSADKDKYEYFATPPEFVSAGLQLIDEYLPDRALILDPGAGDGNWGAGARLLRPNAYICGVEVRNTPKHPAYNDWFVENYLRNGYSEFDAVIGNPPFSIAEAWLRHSLAAVHDGGVVTLFLRLAFLEGQRRAQQLWREVGIPSVTVFSKRPSFSGDGLTSTIAYGMFTWRKNAALSTELRILDKNFALVTRSVAT